MRGVQPAPRPELAAKVEYLTWTGDYLLRQVVYEVSVRRSRLRRCAARRHTPNAMLRGAVGSFACSARSKVTAGYIMPPRVPADKRHLSNDALDSPVSRADHKYSAPL